MIFSGNELNNLFYKVIPKHRVTPRPSALKFWKYLPKNCKLVLLTAFIWATFSALCELLTLALLAPFIAGIVSGDQALLARGPNFILKLFSAELSIIEADQEFRDSKTELQELLQSKKLKLPIYITSESNSGFDCRLELPEGLFEASGNSKRQAEIAAAKEALSHLKKNNA